MNISGQHFEALAAVRDQPPTPKNLERSAREYGIEAARWAFCQWELRKKAAAKFKQAAEMLFTAEALEQSTHEAVAKWRASQFPKGALVADLTTGIGGDLIALAKRGPVFGFDLDPERVAYAQHNLKVHGLEAEVRCASALDGPEQFDYVYGDPGRRVGTRRAQVLSEYQPDPREVVERFERVKLGCLKLSPLLPNDALSSLGSAIQFLSYGKECREAVVWFGSEAGSGVSAVRVDTGATLAESAAPEHSEVIGKYIWDCDPAAVRAHALGNFGLAAVGDHPGYLTGDQPHESEWLKGYQVLWTGAFDLRKLRSKLSELNCATPELKQRGAGLDLIKVRAQLKGEGRRQVAIAFWKEARALRAAILDARP